MCANVRQLIASLLMSILLPMGFINPAGAAVLESDLLDTSSGIAHFGSTHRNSFTDLLEFNSGEPEAIDGNRFRSDRLPASAESADCSLCA